MKRVTIVGSGLTGSTIARCLADTNEYEILILEARSHLSGNVYDPVLPNGVRIHAHGPHAFHTNDEGIFRFLSRFTNWHEYQHRVLARIDDVQIPVPFNYTSLRILVPNQAEAWITHLKTIYAPNETASVLRMRESNDRISRLVAELAYEAIFVEYSRKQWGCEPEELGPSVLSRVPIRMGLDDRYFADRFQGVPAPGYHELVQAMLNHERIRVETSAVFGRHDIKKSEILVFTGAVDAFLDYEFGPLPYRSLRFEFESLDQPRYQDVAQVNYPQFEPWTRVSEFKHMTGQVTPSTAIAREYPQAHLPGINDPYYPMSRHEDRRLHRKYEAEVERLFPNVRLAGRLADYRYYNMDQAVARGRVIARQILHST